MSYTYEYPRAALATDCVIFGYDGKSLKVLLIKRGREPFLGSWALPGGFLRMDETVQECARRELWEETGLKSDYIEQFGVFSSLHRDPRERVVSIAFYALVPISAVKGGDDAAQAEWFDIDDIPTLAFDHAEILKEARKKLKENIYFKPVGFELMPKVFTIPELQRLYEIILETKLERSNFQKKILGLNVVEESGDRPADAPRRVAKTYSFNEEAYNNLKEDHAKFEF